MEDALFTLDGAQPNHPAVGHWFAAQSPGLGDLAKRWFQAIRDCGNDVMEVLHDHQATACVEGAAFAYVGVYTAHVSIGFFHGASLPDRTGLLQGSGKWMRHVKLLIGKPIDENVLEELIIASYRDIRERLAT